MPRPYTDLKSLNPETTTFSTNLKIFRDFQARFLRLIDDMEEITPSPRDSLYLTIKSTVVFIKKLKQQLPNNPDFNRGGLSAEIDAVLQKISQVPYDKKSG